MWGHRAKFYDDIWSDVQTKAGTPYKVLEQLGWGNCTALKYKLENPYGLWAGGCFFQEILTLRGSILQAGTCQIPGLAENPRWSRVWQQQQ